ncbi:MAG: DUF4070 domain-containing protein [Candidatus Tectimicrobiota bacterium]
MWQGSHRKTLALAAQRATWQVQRYYPFSFATEASYELTAFYERALRSLEDWQVSPHQHAPTQSRAYMLGVLPRSILQQGFLASYRRASWQYVRRLLRQWRGQPQKLWLGLTILLSGHHCIRYTQAVVADLATELRQNTTTAPEGSR